MPTKTIPLGDANMHDDEYVPRTPNINQGRAESGILGTKKDRECFSGTNNNIKTTIMSTA